MPRRKSDNRNLGKKGELLAEKLLKKRGYKILQKNYYTKSGEIDIVAEDDGVLVFVEVKLRKTRRYGMPEMSVTPSKLKKITKAGQFYMLENKIRNRKVRIDVVSLLYEKNKLIRSKLIKVDKI